jgi:uncharacterized protein (DUF488 family)
MNKIVTIGVYGFDEDGFFQALVQANVDVFCDIRLRRGVRGSQYAFANSQRLQKKLAELGIEYIYVHELAPSREVRAKQDQEDKSASIAKRKRTTLGSTFIEEYEKSCLAYFDAAAFISSLDPYKKVLCFFCVEGQPEACHRSLAAAKIAQGLHMPVEHIRPSMVL